MLFRSVLWQRLEQSTRFASTLRPLPLPRFTGSSNNLNCWMRRPARTWAWCLISTICGTAALMPRRSPESIRDIFFCVDFCDSVDNFGERGDVQQRGRDVWTGGGRIPLKEWVDAVQATGFDGIWRCELLSPKYWELDPWQTARDLKSSLEKLLV